MFFGLGSDGTVGANKASVKIIGESTDLFAQGYFVYDSKKSGSVTVSHLRFGPEPIRSTYLIDDADFVACHQFGLLGKIEGARVRAGTGRRSCSTPRTGPTRSGTTCRATSSEQLVDKEIDFWVIDALAVADEAGMGNRINTVMQPCFFQLAGVLPAGRGDRPDQGLRREDLRQARRGDRRSATSPPSTARSSASPTSPLGGVDERAARRRRRCPTTRPTSSRRITARLMAGDGDLLPVSALPVDGTFPTGTAKYEKRAIAQEIPIWDPDDLHRLRQVRDRLPPRHDPDEGVPDVAPSRRRRPTSCTRSSARRTSLDHRLTIQVAPDDCTGCGVCVDVCPAKSKTEIEPQGDQHGAGRRPPRRRARRAGTSSSRSRRSTASLLPARLGQGLAGARAAVRVLGRLRRLRRDALHPARQPALRRPHDRRQRDRLLVDLRRQPADHAVDGQRRRPRPGVEQLAVRGQRRVRARDAPRRSTPRPTTRAGCSSASPRSSAPDLVDGLLGAAAGHRGRDRRPARAGRPAARARSPASTVPRASDARHLLALAERPRPPGRLDHRRRRLGLRHRLRRPRPRPVVRSQRQHPRPRHRGLLEHRRPGVEGDAARRRGQVRGRRQGHRPRRTSARSPASYGNVYVAQVSMGANELQTTKALLEADAWPGPSLVIAYSTCIAHGIDMSKSMTPPEGRGQERLLAAVPLPPVRDRGRPAVQARLERAVDPGRRLRRDRDPLRRPPADASGAGGGARGAGPGRRRRALALLRAARRHRTHRPARPSTRPRRSCPTSRATPATATRAKGTGHDGRPAHPLPRPRPALADRRVGLAAQRRAGHGRASRGRGRRRRSSCRRCSRRRSCPRSSSSTARSSRAPSTSPRRSTTSPTSTRSPAPADRYLAALERVKAQSSVPVIASLNATTRRRLGPLRAAHRGRRRRRARAEPVPRRRRPAPDGGRHGGRRPRAHRRRPRRGHDPARGQAQPVLLGVRQLRRRGRRRRRRRARAVQPLLPARPRPRHARGRAAARAEPALGAAPAAALDRDPATAARPRRLARRHLRRPQPGPTSSRR